MLYKVERTIYVMTRCVLVPANVMMTFLTLTTVFFNFSTNAKCTMYINRAPVDLQSS